MKFKVGNRVEHEIYGKGTVIGVSNIDTPLVEFDVCHGLHDGAFGEINGTRGKYGHCWYTDMIRPIESQTIVIYPKGLETIALLKEGKKVIKQANAKCNPTDEFDFNVGAKLAFSRLMGDEAAIIEYLPSIREVKRPAKVGEWIKITHSYYDDNSFNNGDILEVLCVDASGYLKISTTNNPRGDCWNWVTSSDDYVVLENYQPEETAKTLADYTDKELINELSRRWEDKQ